MREGASWNAGKICLSSLSRNGFLLRLLLRRQRVPQSQCVLVLYVDLVFDTPYPVIAVVGYGSKVIVILRPTFSRTPNNMKSADFEFVGCLLSLIVTY